MSPCCRKEKSSFLPAPPPGRTFLSVVGPPTTAQCRPGVRAHTGIGPHMRDTAIRSAGVTPTVETAGLEQIQEEQRHGHPRSLFGIWTSTNLTLGAFVTGALGIQLGLSLGQ